MKKIILSASALIISASLCLTAFSSCKKVEVTDDFVSEISTKTYNPNDNYTYKTALFNDETHTTYVHVVPDPPSNVPKRTSSTAKESDNPSSAQTAASQQGGKPVQELKNGIGIVSKTSPVIKGNSANIMIMGTPDSEFTIEFYESDTKIANYSGLGSTRSDSSGFASWTFIIGDSCEIGERKIIIREKNSDKFIQTYITVN